MARELNLDPAKTYATEANARKAVEKMNYPAGCRFFIVCTPEGRFFPIFSGPESIHCGVHFHFQVVN